MPKMSRSFCSCHWLYAMFFCKSWGWSSWTALTRWEWIHRFLVALWHDQWDTPVCCNSRRNNFAGEAKGHCFMSCAMLPVSARRTSGVSVVSSCRTIFWTMLFHGAAKRESLLIIFGLSHNQIHEQNENTLLGRMQYSTAQHVVRTGYAGTGSVLWSTQCFQVPFSLANDCIIYYYLSEPPPSESLSIIISHYSIFLRCQSTVDMF
jgi:hypothetical protein